MNEKHDIKVNVDELLLNVLGSEFFKSRQLPIRFIPVTPKASARSGDDKELVNL
jgi:hypothetical protein